MVLSPARRPADRGAHARRRTRSACGRALRAAPGEPDGLQADLGRPRAHPGHVGRAPVRQGDPRPGRRRGGRRPRGGRGGGVEPRGRQLDGAPAALDALPAVAQRAGGDAQVLLDGGVRSGADVVTALAIGASAVGIGRPFLYELAADGEDGVAHVRPSPTSG
nr:alpha-hydroxy-acid oxidizing protein [Tomitella gaofuii]